MNDGRQEQMRLTPRCKYRQPFAGRDGEQLCETGGWTSIFADYIELLPLVGVALIGNPQVVGAGATTELRTGQIHSSEY